jgi:opacity protein-like surface antigen
MTISKKISTLLIGSLFSTLALAEGFDFFDLDIDDIDFRPVVAIHGGEVIGMNVGSSKNYGYGITNYDYNKNDQTQIRGLFGGLIGVELDFEEDWALQTGVSYYQTTPFSLEGTLVQNSGVTDPNHNSYSYDITSYQILWESKLLANWGEEYRYHPYVSAGIGASINRARNYETDVNPLRTFTPIYEDKNQTAFSYSFGLGLDYDVTHHFRLGLGYRFTDLGKAALGEGKIDGVPVGHTLEQKNIYAQEIIMQLSYLL